MSMKQALYVRAKRALSAPICAAWSSLASGLAFDDCRQNGGGRPLEIGNATGAGSDAAARALRTGGA